MDKGTSEGQAERPKGSVRTGPHRDIPSTMLGLEGSNVPGPQVSLLKELKVGTWSQLDTCFLSNCLQNRLCAAAGPTWPGRH